MKIKALSMLLILLAAFLLINGKEFQKPQWKGNIEYENGVKVVNNPSEPLYPDIKLDLVEDLVIGKETEKEDHWFSFLNNLTVDDSGNIYTLDPKDIKIRIFNPEGALLRTFGRRGQGPGEFQGPGWIKITPDNVLIVYDILSHKLTYLSLDGKFIKAQSTGKLSSAVIRIDNRGFIYQYKMGRGYETSDELIKCDPNFNPTKKIHSFKTSREPRVINLLPQRYIFELANEDNLVWLLSNSYNIHFVDPDGKTIKRVIKNQNPIKIKEEDKRRIIEQRSLGRDSLPFKYEFPENYPVAASLLIDDRSWIYIQTYETDHLGNVSYDVFDAEGRYFTKFSLPEEEMIVMIKKNKAYCIIFEDDEGIPLVKRYNLEWK